MRGVRPVRRLRKTDPPVGNGLPSVMPFIVLDSHIPGDGRNIKMARKRKYLSGAYRQKIWERFGRKCQICGAETVLFKIHTKGPLNEAVSCAVDHIIPFSKGGKCCDENFQLLCEHCNGSKRDKIW